MHERSHLSISLLNESCSQKEPQVLKGQDTNHELRMHSSFYYSMSCMFGKGTYISPSTDVNKHNAKKSKYHYRMNPANL